MADGAYERRAKREEELKRFERVLRELVKSRKVVVEVDENSEICLENEVDENLTIV